MPDGPYMTPEEHTLQRMLRESGTPEAAAAGLLARLEALEAAVAALEAASGDGNLADALPGETPASEA